MLRNNQLNDKEVEIALDQKSNPFQSLDIPGMPGAQMGMINMNDIFGKGLKNKKKTKLKTDSKFVEKLLEEANFYTEEVRRIISNNYGYDSLYKGGLSIRTPLNSNYQIQAINALRKGLEEYDKRHG